MNSLPTKIFRVISFFTILAVVFLSVITIAQAESSFKKNKLKDKVSKKLNYVPGEVIIKFKKSKINLQADSRQKSLDDFKNKYSLEEKEAIVELNAQVFKSKKTTEETIDELKSHSDVEYIQPNFQYHTTAIDTNDTHRNLMWALDNTGQTVNGWPGTNDADIDAPEAWAISEGSNEAIIAVIDTGVAYNHPDLLANMWDGTDCKDENGGALGHCNYGYDFEDDDRIPLPSTSSHGTHVAGIIAATKNNNKGILGIAPNAKIMALKSSLTTSNNVKSINFAKQNGAKVINASWGSDTEDMVLKEAISQFNGLFIAASGNESVGSGCYPCASNLANIICVAATDQEDNLASFSNYNAVSVDVGAPGENIYSTVPDSTTVMEEYFESVVPPNVPAGWVKGGSNNNWATYSLGGDWGKVLYSDLASPYNSNADTTITSPAYDLDAATGAGLDFWAACDTEYTAVEWIDYMALEYSGDGGNSFTEILKWDEYYLDSDANSSGSAVYHFDGVSIPSQYLTSNFKFRFRWVTDSADNNYDGCLVDDVKINQFSDGAEESYDYKHGTSMATPYVSGLAGLLWNIDSNLTSSEVKDIILTTGDSLASLAAKTVTGKRINANKAVSEILRVASPTADPEGGTFSSSQEVALATVTADAAIYYTLDGSTPTADSLLYSSPITISNNTTLKAIAKKDGLLDSEVMSEQYLIISPSKVGIFRPSNKNFYLKDTNTSGGSYNNFIYGNSTDIPISGDWDGDGEDTVGMFRPSARTFFLKSTNEAAGDVTSLRLGLVGDFPIVGDWNGDGIDTVGIFRPSTKTFYLKSANTSEASLTRFTFGSSTDKPVAGDWNGDGIDTVGIYRPARRTFYLKSDNSSSGSLTTVTYGDSTEVPLAGDWDGDGVDTVGLFRPRTKTFFLKSTNSSDRAAIIFTFGSSMDKPIVGAWAR